MYDAEFTITAGDEADMFNAAIFRFLEKNSSLAANAELALTSTPGGGVEKKCITLWSSEAIDQFREYWRVYRALRTAEAAAFVTRAAG